MDENTHTKSTINFTIELDANRTPARISWTADEADTRSPQEAKSILISIWDPKKMDTIRFDLWTKEMMHEEMATLLFQSFLMMGETFKNSTGNKEMAGEIVQFAEHFGIKTGIIKKAPKADEDATSGGELKPFSLDL